MNNQILMNVSKEIHIPVTNSMENARTMSDTSHAHVMQVSLEMDTTVQVSQLLHA